MLAKEGVSRFDPMGDKFDPNLHNALFEASGRGRGVALKLAVDPAVSAVALPGLACQAGALLLAARAAAATGSLAVCNPAALF